MKPPCLFVLRGGSFSAPAALLRAGAASLAIAMVFGGNLAFAGVIGVSDDTWVREDSPTSNRNGDDFMNARTDSDADDNDVILLGFDLSAKNGPAAMTTLNLTWYRSDGSTGKTLSLYGLNDLSPNETTWSESSVVYNDAPGLVPDGQDPVTEIGLGRSDADVHDLDTANLTLLVADQPYGPQVEGDLYTFASSALDDFLNADTNGQATFLIVRNSDPSSNQARFIQKEAMAFASGAAVGAGGAGAFLGNVPVVPEPASAVLIVLSGLAVGMLRRRS